MACKFRASMNRVPHPIVLSLTTAALLASLCLSVHAEKADRTKPLMVAADRQGSVDLLKQVVVFSGNVAVTKGSIVIKADRVEVRETPDGYRLAIAIGSADRPATFRQKRDDIDEYIDGHAERLEYDERGDVIRFVNNASVRRLRGASTGDEITGRLITYNNTTEVFSVSNTTGPDPAASGPTERVRAVLTPREGTPAAQAAALAASQVAPPLRLSPSLGGKP